MLTFFMESLYLFPYRIIFAIMYPKNLQTNYIFVSIFYFVLCCKNVKFCPVNTQLTSLLLIQIRRTKVTTSKQNYSIYKFILLYFYMYIYNFCNVDKDGTSQLGIRKLVLLENATQELLNMKGELEENDKLYKLKYNSSGYI